MRGSKERRERPGLVTRYNTFIVRANSKVTNRPHVDRHIPLRSSTSSRSINSIQESLSGLEVRLTATCFLTGVFNSQYGVTYHLIV